MQPKTVQPIRLVSGLAVAALSAAAVVLVPVAAAEASSPGPAGRIVFDASLPNGNDAIFSVNPDGSGLTQLTSGNDSDIGPDVSSDGGKIAYSSTHSGHAEIWTMNANGSNQRQLTGDNSVDWYPAWSPDGSTIAFRSDQTGDGDIYTIPADGGTETQLTSAAGLDSLPEYSPDGTKILFHTTRVNDSPTTCGNACDQAVWVMDADGRNQHQVVGGIGERDRFPNWSPDGSRIVYEHTATAGPTDSDGIYIANADGTEAAKVPGTDTNEQGPDFSPDGASISYDHGGNVLDTLPVTGGTPRVIVNSVDPLATDWSVIPVSPPVAAAPTVSSVFPPAGPTAGGTTVTIEGSHFLDATAVRFGSTDATSFHVDSDVDMTAVAPAGSDAQHVTVVNSTGTSVSGVHDLFTYDAQPTVTGLSPSSGSPNGGTAVTVSGTGLGDATSVHFGTTDATFTPVSDTSLTAYSPSGTGIADVTVTTPGGTSTTAAADRFTYAAPVPVVTGMIPTSGPLAGGTVLTLSGTGFDGTTAATVGGVPAPFHVDDDTSMTVTTPAATTPGDAAVTVTNPIGSNAAGAVSTFRYRAAPKVTALSPASGPPTGGTSVRITGTGFGPATGVTFGSTPAKTYSVTSPTTIVATTPRASAGAVDVTVTSPYGTSPTGSADRFTYRPTLQAAVLQPNGTTSPTLAGPSVGGTSLAIYTSKAAANSLSTVTRVRVDGAAVPFSLVTGVKALNGAQLQIVLPPHVAAAVPIVVDGTGWSSPPITFTYSGAAPHLQLVHTVSGTYSSITGGPAAGGTVVDVIGDPRGIPALATATGLTVGGVQVPFTYVSGTGTDNGGQLALRMPAHRAGVVTVVVTEPGWTSPPMTYTYR